MKQYILDPMIQVGQIPWQPYAPPAVAPPSPTGPTAEVAPNAPPCPVGNGWPPPSDVDSGDLPD